jgi:hypothetical protein
MLKGSTYTTMPPMMTSSSFDFWAYLKNIFALELLLKLATFVVEEVIFQNLKKKVQKIIPHRCNRRLKTGNFFQNRYFSHIKFTKNMFKIFFAFKDIK